MRTVDISGMDKSHERYGYEWGCQVIMFRALHWLRSRPQDSAVPLIRYFKNITGVTEPVNEAAKQMEEFALDHEKLKEYGATGAMVQFAIAHAMKRFELGEDGYFAEFKDQADRIFDFDESDAIEKETKDANV